MPPEPQDKTSRDYDAEVHQMLRLASALTGAEVLPKLVDQSTGIGAIPGIVVIATADEEKQDAIA